MKCFFVSDLHGKIDRYEKLIERIKIERPALLFVGGDILPNFNSLIKNEYDDFILDYLIPKFKELKIELKKYYPKMYIIFGNDDPKEEEEKLLKGEKFGIWEYLHNKKTVFNGYAFYGYANVPPTPFLLKDWERYDVSRYVDPGCVGPTEGARSVNETEDIKFATIAKDLALLVGEDKLDKAVFLFHSPPYKSNLDRAALDDVFIDHVPADVHVGSIAIQRFIKEKQPLLTLHGHIHESSRITGSWKDEIDKTLMFSAAIEPPELAIVVFDLEHLDLAARLIT
ncbi:MAG TPA: metallophosphoesterase [Salinivirga sp.]|uniref:metallophosphoesterase family protein n=1 Tax=Salinivirga sp. TaxID=1970192 RepID=UPI002B46D48F|nr:metallophosphoesterase [Salinivirga sp.]HKK60435.1 metallophosphoesterase [Salinivirga sp.]